MCNNNSNNSNNNNNNNNNNSTNNNNNNNIFFFIPKRSKSALKFLCLVLCSFILCEKNLTYEKSVFALKKM